MCICAVLDNRQYDQREAAYGAPPDERTLWLWRDADWRKWERDEPWDWDAHKRRCAVWCYSPVTQWSATTTTAAKYTWAVAGPVADSLCGQVLSLSCIQLDVTQGAANWT